MASIPLADNSNAPITGKNQSSDDVLEIFNDTEEIPEDKTDRSKDKDDKTKDKEGKKEDKTDKEDEEIELAEGDEEEEKLDLAEGDDDKIEIDAPPRKKEILKKYPDLYKDFPFMEKMMYRDKQYQELFGSFDDAKEIAEKAEIFNDFEKQLLSGNTEDVLKNIKETDSKAFDKVVDNYLFTLHKVDKEAYFEVIDRVNKAVIQNMVKEAKESNNEDLQQAALVLNQFLYGSSKFTPAKTRTEEKPNEQNEEAEKERLSFIQERFETSRDDLQTRVDNILKNTISDYIDPKGRMSSYVKKNAVNDALVTLQGYISKDPSVNNTLNKLWRAAFDAKFSKDSLAKIQAFYLGKAKGNLPNAIKKARAEALKDLAPSREKEEEKEEETTPRNRGPLPAGRPSVQKSRDGMKKGESVADFFNRD